jgi:RNA polymerase sigma factor (sigma-70 family)
MERQPKHDDLLDLAQEASLQMIKGLESALTKSNPASYLRGIARRAISMYCIYHSGLIEKPLYTLEQLRQLDQRPSRVESLDAPIYNEGKHILVEFIEAPATPIEPDEEDEQKRYTYLYQAISRLSQTQREILVRLYGLSGQPMESAHEMNPSDANLIHAHAAAARKRLRVLLQNKEG